MLTPRSAWPTLEGAGGWSAGFRPLAAVAAALWPCALYFLCSLAMNILTKALLTTYAWRAVYALGAVQNGFILASLALYSALRRLVQAERRARGKEEEEGERTKPPPHARQRTTAALQVAASIERSSSSSMTTSPKRDGELLLGRLLGQARVVVPLVALHLANVLLGFAGLRAVNLPMCVAFASLCQARRLLVDGEERTNLAMTGTWCCGGSRRSRSCSSSGSCCTR